MIGINLPRGVTISGTHSTGPILDIDTAACRARVSLRGGQILAWQPAGHQPVLWLSAGARFAPGSSIRGGIPICWPWFADHPTDAAKPSHGFARNRDWLLTSASLVDDGVRLCMRLPATPGDDELWPHSSRPSLEVCAGSSLRLKLDVANVDRHPLTFSQALHSYFSVAEIAQVSIDGLQGASYYDKLTATTHVQPAQAITFAGEVDRIYRHSTGIIRLRDPGLRREVAVQQQGGGSIIVWNPWLEKTQRLGDMGDDMAYRTMVCIETGSVAEQAVELNPGESRELITEISVSGLAV